MQKEIWKDIKGYEMLYQASTLGRIKRLEYTACRKNPKNKQDMVFLVPEKILKCTPRSKFGHTVVSLSKNGIVKNFSVHRLIAETFIPNPENKPQVGHIDNNPANNEVSNLEWNTQGENLKHCFKCGRRNNKGENAPAHKLTEKDVLYIRKYYKRGNGKNRGNRYKHSNAKELAIMFGIQEKSISDIIRRYSWKHI